MDYKGILRNKPWLKPCHANGICDRMLQATGGNAFVVFNTVQRIYELHTVDAQRLSGDSYNTTIDPWMLNGWLIHDYLANDLAKNYDEVVSVRQHSEHTHQRNEERRRERDIGDSLKTIERTLGYKL